MLNVVALLGRLTADPELRRTPSGVSVTTFTVAVNRSYVKQGGERQTDFIDVVAWRNTAEFISKYFRKGQMIAVQGSIQTRSYQDKNGNKRRAVEVHVDKADFCGDGKKGETSRQPDFNGFSQGSAEDFAEVGDNGDFPF